MRPLSITERSRRPFQPPRALPPAQEPSPRVRSPASRKRTPAASCVTRPVTASTVRCVALPPSSRLCLTPQITCRCLLPRTHTYPNRNRKPIMALDTGARLGRPRRVGRRRAGNPGDRDIVDKPGRIRENGRQAPLIRGRGSEANKIEARQQRGKAELLVLFRRQVDNDQTIDACVFCISQKPIYAVDIDRIVVAHENNGHVVVCASKRTHHIERLAQGLAGLERPLRGELDCRPIRHGIGKRHAELDHVRTRGWHRLQNGKGGLRPGIARGNESHQRCPAFRLQRSKFPVNARDAHVLLRGSPSRRRRRNAAMRTLIVPSMNIRTEPMNCTHSFFSSAGPEPSSLTFRKYKMYATDTMIRTHPLSFCMLIKTALDLISGPVHRGVVSRTRPRSRGPCRRGRIN